MSGKDLKNVMDKEGIDSESKFSYSSGSEPESSEETMLKLKLPTCSHATYEDYILFTNLLVINKNVYLLLDCLSEELGICKNLGISHLDCILLYILNVEIVLLMLDAVDYFVNKQVRTGTPYFPSV